MPDSPTPLAPQKKKTNWWMIGCGGCLGLIVLGLIGGAVLFFGVMKVIKGTDAYKTALSGAAESPEVQAELGTPIEAGFMAQGNVNADTSGETADLTIPLKGPKGSGHVHYAAKKTGSAWEVSDFTVTIDGTNKTIHVGP